MASSLRKGGFFVDLFVRVSNQVAVNMYKRLGYSVYRTVIEYYSASNGEPDEDAYGELWIHHQGKRGDVPQQCDSAGLLSIRK